MHKLMIVTAIVLAATAAHAEGTRGLITLAASDRGDPTPAEPAKPVEQAKPAEQTAQPAPVQSAETKPVDSPNRRMDQKSRRKAGRESDRNWAERRIRSELARYGIY
jgi:hypothetical protein